MKSALLFCLLLVVPACSSDPCDEPPSEGETCHNDGITCFNRAPALTCKNGVWQCNAGDSNCDVIDMTMSAPPADMTSHD